MRQNSLMLSNMRSSKPAPLKKKPVVSSEGLNCAYSHFTCHQPCLEGYEFCIRHILEDKSAPYRQCNYIYTSNGRRCPLATAKVDKKDGLCPEHARRSLFLRQRATRRKVPSETVDTLLTELSHYNKSQRDCKSASSVIPKVESKATRGVNPFVDIDPVSINDNVSKILDYASDSDSDAEAITVDGAWKGEGDSDAESIDSEQEDPLKHAGIYTAEEVAVITRDKLIRLQSLYIEQFKNLQHILKEKRRKYLLNLKLEKECMMSIHSQPKDSVMERKTYSKLKALNGYHRRSGVEGMLHSQELEKRMQATEGTSYKPQTFPRCQYTEGGVRCEGQAIPLAKHCMKHILEDTNQVLFKACNCVTADMTCSEPVPVVFENDTCVYHIQMPALAQAHKEDLKVEECEVESSSSLQDKVYDMSHAQMADNGLVKAEVGDDPLMKLDSSTMSLDAFNSEVSTDTASMEEMMDLGDKDSDITDER